MNTMLQTKDKYELFTQISEVDNPKATIIFSHGFVEYSAHYSRLHKLFNRQGFNLFKYDLRGHGRTSAPLASVTTYTQYIDDLNDCVQFVKKQSPNLPIFLMGFSLGGLITALYTLFNPYEAQGQILCAPGLKGSNRFLETPNDSITIPEFLTMMNAKGDAGIRALLEMNSPYVLKEITKTFAIQMFNTAQEKIWDNTSNIRLSTLLIHGKQDPMVSVSTSQQFYDAIASIDKQLKIINDGEHDLLRTKHSESIINLICQWCDERI